MYRPTLAPSLRDFSVTIEGGEKVGVVGRTGSGKSTMMQVMYDLLDETTGDVVIDDVNIRDVGLHRFRQKLCAIPQTPTLFNGTLKSNLDPFSDFTNDDVWNALETVQMKAEIEKVSGGGGGGKGSGLDYMVSDSGNNFSVGQKQLLCLARAVLLKSRILLLDEPSANVDNLTDQKLQLAIATAFEGSTIISIAHRLDSIIEYDKVLVVGDGKTLEFGEPNELLQKKGGAFNGMVVETGPQTEAMLREKAKRAAAEREEERKKKKKK